MCLASLQTRKGQLSFPILLAEAACFVSFLKLSSGPCYLIVQDIHIDYILPLDLRLKTGLKTPFLLFISNYLLNLQRFTRLSAIPLRDIFTSLRQFLVLQKRIKNEILEQYMYFIDMPNTSFIIFHAFTNKQEISINFILDKSFEFFLLKSYWLIT